MREIVHIQAGQCGNQIGAKVSNHSIMINPPYTNSMTHPFVKSRAVDRLGQSLKNAEGTTIWKNYAYKPVTSFSIVE